MAFILLFTSQFTALLIIFFMIAIVYPMIHWDSLKEWLSNSFHQYWVRSECHLYGYHSAKVISHDAGILLYIFFNFEEVDCSCVVKDLFSDKFLTYSFLKYSDAHYVYVRNIHRKNWPLIATITNLFLPIYPTKRIVAF